VNVGQKGCIFNFKIEVFRNLQFLAQKGSKNSRKCYTLDEKALIKPTFSKKPILVKKQSFLAQKGSKNRFPEQDSRHNIRVFPKKC